MTTIKHTFAALALSTLAGSALAADAPDQQLIKQGEYLARAADCFACHTAEGGKTFAGGLGIASPLGTIYSSNITPDKKTGIGDYTLEDFDRAVRHGVAKDGHTLYPAMPYPSFSRVSPDDIKALYAFFMNGVAPVEQANKKTDIPWPLSMRWPLSIWRVVFAPAPVDQPASPPGGAGQDELLRGKYLVEGLGHCSACHTPRGFALQEKATSEADGPLFLSGGSIDGWLAKSLRGDAVDGLGSWSKEDIAAFLKTGRNSHAAAFANMAEVVGESTQYLSDADAQAIATYLQALPERAAPPAPPIPSPPRRLMQRGAEIYHDHCAQCHGAQGQGERGAFPALAGNRAVLLAEPTNLVRMILQGGYAPATAGNPRPYGMPPYHQLLGDEDVAAVATFVRNAWGNHAAALDTIDVYHVRERR
jgi:mono/diheme cytochrome c family protein